MSRGLLLVISGPAGSGKGTVIKYLMEKERDIAYSVSATTRSPRPGEVDGESYYFVSRETFLDMINQQAFLEYDAHMDNYYGTPKAQLEEKLLIGNVILDIEPNGAFNVRRERPDAVLIFIAPPSLEELESRLRGRGDTSEEQIRVRQARVAWEMEQSKRYDYVVINDQVDACAKEILNIIAREAD